MRYEYELVARSKSDVLHSNFELNITANNGHIAIAVWKTDEVFSEAQLAEWLEDKDCLRLRVRDTRKGQVWYPTHCVHYDGVRHYVCSPRVEGPHWLNAWTFGEWAVGTPKFRRRGPTLFRRHYRAGDWMVDGRVSLLEAEEVKEAV